VISWFGFTKTRFQILNSNVLCCYVEGKGVLPLLKTRGVVVVDCEGWRRIDAAERAAGAAVGKPREKLVDLEEMLRVAAPPPSSE
jgi:hypothetical protein